MILVCLNSAFGIVDSMVSRRGELILELLLLQVCDHITGDFIIKSNHLSCESIVGEDGVTGLESSNEVTGLS